METQETRNDRLQRNTLATREARNVETQETRNDRLQRNRLAMREVAMWKLKRREMIDSNATD